jgi:antibiotic biosynthesis monooxygenase (ABM) superfamily enzyme
MFVSFVAVCFVYYTLALNAVELINRLGVPVAVEMLLAFLSGMVILTFVIVPLKKMYDKWMKN